MENFFFKKRELNRNHPFDLPESFSHYETIFDLYHDYLVLHGNKLFLIDKKTSEQTDVAEIDSSIIHFSPSLCMKYFILISDNETILLNDKFDLIKSESIVTTKCYVCWGDDQVLISRDKIYIYNLKLDLLYTGYGHTPIGFRDDYFVYCIFNDQKFTFIEQNGLVLETLDNITIKGSVKDIRFINKNLIVGIFNDGDEYFLFVMYCHSNYWYLKKVIKMQFFEIHSIIENSIFIKENNNLWEYAIEEYTVEYNGLFGVNDGKELKITNFNEGFLPQPLEHYKIRYCDFINGVALWENFICLVSCDEIVILQNKKILKTINLADALKFKREFNLINNESKIDILHVENLSLDCNGYFEFVQIFNYKLYFIHNAHLFTYSIDKKQFEKVICVKNINSVHLWNNVIFYRDNENLFSNHLKIPIGFKQSLALASHKNLYFYLIDTNLNINIGGDVISIDQVSSFIIFNDFLIFVKKEKLVTYNLKTNIYHLYSLHEKNSKILYVRDTKIIISAKWGNFEIYESRFFLQQKIHHLIENKNFKEALKLANGNCITFSIFGNKRFTIKEFIESLSDPNSIVNFTFQIYEDFDKNFDSVVLEKVDLKAAMAQFNLDKETFSLYKKMVFVFDPLINTKNKFLQHVMENIGEDLDSIKVKIYTKLSLLDEAMFLIMKNHELLGSAKNIQRDEKFIQAALGTYNLDFTEMVIKALRSDIYLDFIAEIRHLEEIEKRIAINKSLNRKDKVIFYLSQKDEDEERNYIIENKLFGSLDKLREYYSDEYPNQNKLPFLSIFDGRLVEGKRSVRFYDILQGDYFYNIDKARSIDYYLAGKDEHLAFKVSLEVNDWEKACEINKSLKIVENYSLIIQTLIKSSDYKNVGFIYHHYLNDQSQAYLYYLKSQSFNEAKNLNLDKFNADLPSIIERVDEEIRGYIEYVKQLIIRFDSIITRKSTFDDLSTTSTMTTSSKKNVLRNKVGSRFEKEYVLDQVRRSLESIKLINKNLIEVGIYGKGEINEVWNDVLRIFHYAHDCYDGVGPYIELPDMDY